jgi:hypothetical protein
MIVSQYRYSFGGLEKSRKLACHVVNSNIAIAVLCRSSKYRWQVATIALFEKIYDGKPILTVFSNSGEDVQ